MHAWPCAEVGSRGCRALSLANPLLSVADSSCFGGMGVVRGMETSPFRPDDPPRPPRRTYVVVQRTTGAPGNPGDARGGASAEWITRGTVCAPARREAIRLAAARFGSPLGRPVRVVAAGSVAIGLLIGALAADGRTLLRDERHGR